MKWRARLWMGALLWGAMHLAPVGAAPAIMPLAELKPGQTGIGKTVIRGATITTFDFEILDLLETEGFASNLILVKLGGPLVEELGGIAAGMSGSPLFIDDKMIGAVAFTTPFSDTRFGYATPIEDMLKVLQLGNPEVRQARARGLAGLPVGTPVMVQGLHGRALAGFQRVLRRFGHRAVDEPGVPVAPVDPNAVPAAGELAPGSAIAASLSTGDVVLTALGTLTWRDGDQVLAFGHPFLQRGETSLFLHPAYIYGVVPSDELAFKIGAPAGPPVGAFEQDRAAGLGGRLGRAARSVAVTIDAGDLGLNRRRQLSIQIIDDPELAPTLVAICAMQALSEVMDRLGGGTATMAWSVEGDGLAAPLRRQDMVYSATDVVSETLGGPLFTLDALLRNDFQAVTPKSVSIKVDVANQRRTARLVAVKCEPETVAPGGEVTVTARLQPYRGTAFDQTLTLRVPPGATAGRLVLEAHGRPEAAAGPLSQAALMSRGIKPPASFAELLSALAATERGDALVAELLTPEAAAARQQMVERLEALPALDLFSEEIESVPSLGGLAQTNAQPLARGEVLVDQVVQGRLRAAVTVSQP